MTNRALPDVELAVVTRLRDVLDGYDIGTTLGNTLPAITVDVAGGVPLIETVLDEPRVTITGWAEHRLDAWQACASAVEALVTPPIVNDSGWTAGGVTVHRCFTTMRPYYSFDPVAQKPRYVSTVGLVART